jgi:hypothetical protein
VSSSSSVSVSAVSRRNRRTSSRGGRAR